MDMEQIRLHQLVVGCVLDAFPKWKKKGVRIANHLAGYHNIGFRCAKSVRR